MAAQAITRGGPTMSRRLRTLSVTILALVPVCGAARAEQATLTLFPDVAVWNDVVEARIQGTGCTGLAAEPTDQFLPGTGWVVDIDLTCPSGSTAPFSIVVELGPLYPQNYTVRVHNVIRHIVSPPPPALDTAPLSVRRQASLEIVLPAAATDAAPFPIVFRGPAPSSCFLLDPPVVHGNVIETTFDNNCPILPPGGPHVFEETFQVGPLPAGEYDVRFLDFGVPQGEQPYLERKTLIVHDADRCVPSDTALCLQDGRFRVEVAWRDFKGNTGKGHSIPLA